MNNHETEVWQASTSSKHTTKEKISIINLVKESAAFAGSVAVVAGLNGGNILYGAISGCVATAGLYAGAFAVRAIEKNRTPNQLREVFGFCLLVASTVMPAKYTYDALNRSSPHSASTLHSAQPK